MAQRKFPKTVRMGDDTVMQWDALARKLGLDRSEVVALAIRRLAEAEGLASAPAPVELPGTAQPLMTVDAHTDSPGAQIVESVSPKMRRR